MRKRKNHRLKDYDYGNYGYYFITICTLNRKNVLSTIVGSDALVAPEDALVAPEDVLIAPEDVLIAPENVRPSPYIVPTKLGKKVIESFNNIALLNENVQIDKFVLMPNHIHAIIIITNTEEIEKKEKKFDFEITERRGRRSLQGLIKDFKSVTTRIYKKMYNSDLSLWQESFYDEVIKNKEHYFTIWQYIDENPLKWADDELYTPR